jgi:uncharacterized membrane protein
MGQSDATAPRQPTSYETPAAVVPDGPQSAADSPEAMPPEAMQPEVAASHVSDTPADAHVGTAASDAESSQGPQESVSEEWYLQTEGGQKYGPVSRAGLDKWVAEGRVDSSCQLLRDSWDQWKWADEVLADLAGIVGPATPGDGMPDILVPGVSTGPPVAEMPAVAPAFADSPIPAVTGSAAPAIEGSAGGKGGTPRRKYPALDMTAKIYRFMAVVVGVLGLIAAVGYAVMALSGSMPGQTLEVLFIAGFILVYTFLAVVSLLALAELIRLLMNMEHDAHVTADASRQMVDLLKRRE